MESAAEFSNVLLCDDVREEVNHKRIVIGIYSGPVLVTDMPAQLNLTFYIEHRPPAPGTRKIEFILSFADKDIAKVGMEASTTDHTLVNVIPFPKFGLKVERDADLMLTVSVNGSPHQILLRKPVQKGLTPSSSSSDSEQHSEQSRTAARH